MTDPTPTPANDPAVDLVDAPAPVHHHAPDGLGPPPATGHGERVAVAVLVAAVAIAVVGSQWGRFAPDTRPDLYQQPGRLLASSLQAWVGGANGLGQGNFNTGIAPVAAVVWVLRAIGTPVWLAVRIWRLAVLLFGAWGIRRYLAALLGDRLTAAGRFAATAFWLVNPYLIVGGNSTPILLPYALLPWTLLALVRATRSPRSWRWPAAFALGFFAQTGLNAGVVPFFQLVAVPVHLVYASRVERARARDLLRVFVRCGLLAVAVSFYWLVPSLLATGTGSGIAAATESPRDVAQTSSYSEVARLLGNWPLYGRSGSRPFLPEDTPFLLDPIVVLATFLVPAGIAAAVMRTRARERLLGALLVLVGLPIMVGIFPPDHPPPAGHLLRTIFDRVAASLAFRTTNKVGAVVVLGYTVLLAVGIGAWARRNRARPGARSRAAVLAAVATAVVVAATVPMWTNGLYAGSYKIPSYWTAATRHLDESDHESRVLVVPGGTGGNYRWGERSPDDLFPSLLARPVAVRNTVVGRGDPAANFLASFDTDLQQGSLPPGALSAVARYLGASDVLVRSDLLTEEISGAPPSVIRSQVVADPGLRHDRSFGSRGEHTLPGTAARGSDASANHAKAAAADPADAAIRPVEIWHVTRPEPVVRAAPAASQLLVDGDGDAVPAMAAFGLDDGVDPLRLLGGFDAGDLATAARDGGHFVLTDTNRRRAWDINRVTDATSPTLRADQDIDAGNGATLTLWPDRPSRQSVSELVGARSIDATSPAFGLRPFGKPTYAFDGDPGTAWETGELGTAAGDHIRIRFDSPRKITQLTIQFAAGGPSRIDQLAIITDHQTVPEPVDVTEDSATYAIPATRTSSLEIRILHQTAGANPVGIAEVTLPGLDTAESIRLPTSYDRLVRSADAATQRRVAALPLDVVLTRAQGATDDPSDDEEHLINREVELPQPRTFRFSAQLPFEQLDPDVRTTIFELAPGAPRPCQTVAYLDRTPVRARVTTPLAGLAVGHAVTLEGCRTYKLAAGRHGIISSFAWAFDRMRLSSPGTHPTPTAAAPAVHVTLHRATREQFTVAATHGAYWLRLGQAFDRRWRLSMDGHDLGPPTLLDGYSSGWRIADPRAHHFEATFPAERAVQGTFVVSAAALVGVVALVAWPGGAVPVAALTEDEDGDDPEPSREPKGEVPDGR